MIDFVQWCDCFFVCFVLFFSVHLFGSIGSSLYAGSLVETCGTSFPDQEFNLGPLYWVQRVLATGPPWKSQTLSSFYTFLFNKTFYFEIIGGSQAIEPECEILCTHCPISPYGNVLQSCSNNIATGILTQNRSISTRIPCVALL